MKRSKRVSFHQEVTVKEFIKKTGNSSLESDTASPDLYRAPINHRGEGMDETVTMSDDSSMELTGTIENEDVLKEGPGELSLTMMFKSDMQDDSLVNKSLMGEATGFVEPGSDEESGLNLTMAPSCANIDSLAKKLHIAPPNTNTSTLNTSTLNSSTLNSSSYIAPPNTNTSTLNTSTLNSSSFLNESETTLRRSSRISRRSDESQPAVFRTPTVTLNKAGRKRGSASKSSSRHKKNVSLVSANNSLTNNSLTNTSLTNTSIHTRSESKSFTNISQFQMSLLENSGEGSGISLLSLDDTKADKEAAAKRGQREKLIAKRDELRAKVEKTRARVEVGKGHAEGLKAERTELKATRLHPSAVRRARLLGIEVGEDGVWKRIVP